MFDDCGDYRMEGNNNHEYLFPLVVSFFEEYETFINECALSDDVDNLNGFFDESWREYADLLNKAYCNLRKYLIEGSIKYDNDVECGFKRLEEKMKFHYNKIKARSKKEELLIKNIFFVKKVSCETSN